MMTCAREPYHFCNVAIHEVGADGLLDLVHVAVAAAEVRQDDDDLVMNVRRLLLRRRVVDHLTRPE